ncbi:hypothetical protein [Actinoplanes sp. NPDC049118]|uniref:type II secretion system F family protein n=1 Tax=Actinoplanes sp. NPDC049118 TaxID=3155769 RepID=UPI0033CFA768
MSWAAWVLAAGLLAAAAAVAVWPARTVARRLRAQRPARRLGVPSVDLGLIRGRARELVDRRPRRVMGAAALSGATAGLIVAGPVASFVLAACGVLGMRAAVRRSARRRAAAARSRSLDELTALAADLRAGLAMGGSSIASGSPGSADLRAGLAMGGSSLASGPPGSPGASARDQRLADLAAAVWRLAERTGAPAADLVERIEADARADDRSRAMAAAQAAGAQATALLLAALPVGGIGLGYSVGVDPLQVLLHTPLGAACAVGAVLLQSTGLLWADRLANGPGR